jgi:hypothetical protein
LALDMLGKVSCPLNGGWLLPVPENNQLRTGADKGNPTV